MPIFKIAPTELKAATTVAQLKLQWDDGLEDADRTDAADHGELLLSAAVYTVSRTFARDGVLSVFKKLFNLTHEKFMVVFFGI
jgi:hypothetical protein